MVNTEEQQVPPHEHDLKQVGRPGSSVSVLECQFPGCTFRLVD